MRLTFLFLSATTVSAKYEGFFGKPTSNVESNEKTRRIEQQLRRSLGGDSKKLKSGPSAAGPRGAKAKPDQETKQDERDLQYYYDPGYGYHMPQNPIYDPYYPMPENPIYDGDDYYGYPKYKYPQYKYPIYYPGSKKSKKGGKMKGGKMWGGGKMGMMSWKKWQQKWQGSPVYRKCASLV